MLKKLLIVTFTVLVLMGCTKSGIAKTEDDNFIGLFVSNSIEPEDKKTFDVKIKNDNELDFGDYKGEYYAFVDENKKAGIEIGFIGGSQGAVMRGNTIYESLDKKIYDYYPVDFYLDSNGDEVDLSIAKLYQKPSGEIYALFDYGLALQKAFNGTGVNFQEKSKGGEAKLSLVFYDKKPTQKVNIIQYGPDKELILNDSYKLDDLNGKFTAVKDAEFLLVELVDSKGNIERSFYEKNKGQKENLAGDGFTYYVDGGNGFLHLKYVDIDW